MKSPVASYQTHAEFMTVHEQLMQWLNGAPPADAVQGEAAPVDAAEQERLQLLPMIGPLREFLHRGAAGGAYLYEPAHRRSAQAMLDYWSMKCYSAEFDVGRAVLAEHDARVHPKLDDARCPYVGLDAFDERRAPQFFGRSAQVSDLVDRLREQRLVVVTGDSGSGKSSLVLAGLIPALRAGAIDGSAGWRYPPRLVPGATPLLHLAKALQPAGADEGWVAAQAQRFAADPAHLVTLLDADPRDAVLVVDQFEEAMTLRTADTAPAFDRFVAHLVGVAGGTGPRRHRIVLTMRNGSVEAQLARDYPALEALYARAAFPLYSMGVAHLREAIEKPAASVGLVFTGDVVDRLVESVAGESSNLPLLQFSLMTLWKARQGNLITPDAYRMIGDPRQAMAEEADRLFADLGQGEKIATEVVFLILSTRGEGGTVYRNRATRRTLKLGSSDPANVDAVLSRFEAARLIRITPSASGDPADDVAEVAHESLLRHWGFLVRLFERHQAGQERRAFLLRQAEKWQQEQFDPAFLLSGLALQQAIDEYRTTPPRLVEQSFLKASLAFEAQVQADKEAQARAKNRALRVIAGVGLLVAVGCMALYVTTSRQATVKLARADAKLGAVESEVRQRVAEADVRAALIVEQGQQKAALEVAAAEQVSLNAAEAASAATAAMTAARAEQSRLKLQADLSRAGALALAAEKYALTDGNRSVTLALEARALDPSLRGSVISAVLDATRGARPLKATNPTDGVGLRAMALDPAGHRLAVVQPGGGGIKEDTIDGTGGGKPRSFALHEDAGLVRALAYSPDGQSLAAATEGGLVVWHLPDGSARTFGPAESWKRLSFSRNSQWIAALEEDGEDVQIWSMSSGASVLSQKLPRSDSMASSAHSVVFTSDSNALIVLQRSLAGDRFQALRYRLVDGSFQSEPDTLTPTQCPARGQIAAGGGRAGVITLAQLCIYELPSASADSAPLPGVPRTELAADQLHFSEDGRFILKVSVGTRDALVTDTVTGKAQRLMIDRNFDLTAITDASISFNRNGTRLAMQDTLGALRIYKLDEAAQPLQTYGRILWVSPDDKQLAVPTNEKGRRGVALHDLKTGALRRHLDSNDREFLTQLYATPDGGTLFGVARCAELCIVEVPMDGRPATERPFVSWRGGGPLSTTPRGRADIKVWQVGSTQPVFEMRASAASPQMLPSIELSDGLSFAAKIPVPGGVRIDVYLAQGAGAAKLLLSLPLSTSQSAQAVGVAFHDKGRVLLVRDGQSTTLRDLQRDPDRAISLGRAQAGQVAVPAGSRRVYSRTGSQEPWSIHDMDSGALLAEKLPAEFRFAPGAKYAWRPVRDGKAILVRSLDGATPPFEIDGPTQPRAWSAKALAVEVPSPDGNRVRVFRLDSGRMVLEVASTSVSPFRLSPSGQYLIDVHQRLIPTDEEEVLRLARDWLAKAEARRPVQR